jgi:predicted site-specific integrase-resolvase
MYSAEKLKELEAMDGESYQFYFKNGPKPTWTKEQWAELRQYQSQRKAERFQKMNTEYANLSAQQKEDLRKQLKKMEAFAELEVKRQLEKEAAEDRENR